MLSLLHMERRRYRVPWDYVLPKFYFHNLANSGRHIAPLLHTHFQQSFDSCPRILTKWYTDICPLRLFSLPQPLTVGLIMQRWFQLEGPWSSPLNIAPHICVFLNKIWRRLKLIRTIASLVLPILSHQITLGCKFFISI